MNVISLVKIISCIKYSHKFSFLQGHGKRMKKNIIYVIFNVSFVHLREFVANKEN
jgi:hypothetical protein